MRKNLDRLGGLIHSQRVLLALTQKGVSREDAYSLVQRNAMPVWRGKGDFLTLLKADRDVAKRPGLPAHSRGVALNERILAQAIGIEPHVAINGTAARPAKRARLPSRTRSWRASTLRSNGCASASRSFGWSNTVGGLAQVKVRGLVKVHAGFNPEEHSLRSVPGESFTPAHLPAETPSFQQPST